MFVIPLLCLCTWSIAAAVLDPSLYLSPRPPLIDSSEDITPEALWSARSADIQMTKETNEFLPGINERTSKIKRKPDPAERAKFFWPSLRTAHSSVKSTGSIQIPLTFSLSGLYGSHAPGAFGTGMIGSSYGTVSEIGGAPVSSLAGSGYGNYRTLPKLRIYSGENGPAWSGWGNGKWGHYGKG